MEQKCVICGKEMKLIKAGVSKRTGKPYEAFYSCPDRCQQPKGINTAGKSVSLESIDKKLDRILAYYEDTITKKTNEALDIINTDDIPF